MISKHYDFLNKLQRWLPSLGVFWMAISASWGLPYGDAVKETILALASLLAATLEISSVGYYKAKAGQEAAPGATNTAVDKLSEETISPSESAAEAVTDVEYIDELYKAPEAML